MAEQADHRSLRILGVRGYTLEAALAYQVDGACVSAIALSAAMLESDERVRRMVLAAVESGLPELRLWGEGDSLPAELSGRAQPASHQTVIDRPPVRLAVIVRARAAFEESQPVADRRERPPERVGHASLKPAQHPRAHAG